MRAQDEMVDEIAEMLGEEGQEVQEGLQEEDILTIIAAEMSQASTGNYSTELDGNREDSLDYYLGNPRGDEQEGRSQLVSTDVADAIEWIMPQIMKAMTAKGAVVEFDSIGPDDEDQAELETAFTHDVFMKENRGFLNLYEYIKDALMQKNGIFKIYYDDTGSTKTEQYSGLSDPEVEMLLKHPDVELVSMEEVVDEVAVQRLEEQLQQMQQQAQQAMQQMQQKVQQLQDPEAQQQAQQAMQQKMQQAKQAMKQMSPEERQQAQQAMQQQMQQADPKAQLQQLQQQGQQAMQQGQQAMQQLQQQLQDPPKIVMLEVEVTTSQGKIVVDCVAPEEFRINQHHDSLDLDAARFAAHVRLRTKSELLEEGYDPEIILKAEDNLTNNYEREYRFAMQDENVYSDPNYSEDPSQALLEVSECYMMIDIEGSGRAKLMQITVLGSDDPTDILEVTPIEASPFVSSSCIIMSHKFFGLSIYDRLKQLQDTKTSLWRNIMDNLYLQNNREKEVVEDQVNLDDLLVSRPGGIKRVKQPGMIRELMVQPIGQEGYQMLDYLDQVRTGRVGVSPDTAGQVDALGTAVGSEGVAQLLSAKEELTGLMVRVIAETGLTQAYVKIRDLLVRHKDGMTPFKFKGEWQQVDPSQWGDRSRTTVKVGTGTGDDSRKVGAIQQVIAYQAQIVQDSRNTLVNPPQIFEALDEFCRVSGLTGASPYFLDPGSKEGQQKQAEMDKDNAEQKQKQEQLEQMMAKAQADMGEGERMKGEASMQAQQAKIQVEGAKMELEHQKYLSEDDKNAFESMLAKKQTEIDELRTGEKLSFDYAKLEQEEALKLTELELKYKLEGKKLQQQYVMNSEKAEKEEGENNG